MSAVISPCGHYRYRLERQCAGDGQTAIIMVNPSTADAERDDATIRKLRGFGDRNIWGRIVIGNLFAWRATDVRELATAPDPVGSKNDNYLFDMMLDADRIVVAWGPLAKQPRLLRARWRHVMGLGRGLEEVFSIGRPAKDGHPRHPLMLAYAEPIQRWTPPKDADA